MYGLAGGRSANRGSLARQCRSSPIPPPTQPPAVIATLARASVAMKHDHAAPSECVRHGSPSARQLDLLLWWFMQWSW